MVLDLIEAQRHPNAGIPSGLGDGDDGSTRTRLAANFFAIWQWHVLRNLCLDGQTGLKLIRRKRLVQFYGDDGTDGQRR